MEKRFGHTVRVSVVRVWDERGVGGHDEVVTEEPMEIRVRAWDGAGWQTYSVAVTMRTPGNDFELAVGFLFTEGVLSRREDIRHIAYCADPAVPQHYNIVTLHLHPDCPFDPHRFSRHIFTASGCGVCGKTALEFVQTVCPRRPIGDFQIPRESLLRLPQVIRGKQRLFSRTGGLHASALFDSDGKLLFIREDIGRHNAMDKLIGALFLRGRLPAFNTLVLVSGRASFELVQKAVVAGIPFLAAIGAPSSLAIALAEEYGVTLVGFLRDGRFNIYTGPGRIVL